MTQVNYRFYARAIGERDGCDNETVTIEGTLEDSDVFAITRSALVEPFLRWLEGLGYNVEDMRDHAELE